MGGMTRLLLLLWAGVTVGSVVDLQKRIIGGVDCSVKERGYHAFLTFTNATGPFICSGSLIHKQWILTAAHCGIPEGKITAVLGRDPLSKTTVEIEPTPKPFEDKDDKTKKHDIMLLKLKNPTNVEPVSLPIRRPDDCANKPKEGETVQIAGYYSTIQPGKENGPGQIDYSKPLQCADIKVVKCPDCKHKTYVYDYQHIFCYQDEKKKVDTTGGDSGGGVVFNKMIYGVHVRGKREACTGEAKAVDLCEDIYKKWILETITAKSSG